MKNFESTVKELTRGLVFMFEDDDDIILEYVD